MKNSKLFKSLSALALAGIMAFSSVSLVSAEETQVTDKESFDMVFENEVGVKYLSEEDTIAVVEAMYGKSISEITGLTMDKYADVHIVDDNTVFSVNWDNSTYSEEDVTEMYIETYLWYKDDSGKFNFAKCYDEVALSDGDNTVYRLGYDFNLLENAKGEFNIQDNLYYSSDDYRADGGDEGIFGYEESWEIKGPGEYVGGSLWMKYNYHNMISSEIMDIMNSTDKTSWNEIQEVFFNGVGNLDGFDSFFNNNMFLARVCIKYTHPETGETHTSWTYIASESALTSENNPFTYLDEMPTDDTDTDDTDKDDTTTEVKEVTLTEDNKSISKDDMVTLITENATKDVVIKTPVGITLTFAKGTMKAVDGKDTYDFGVSMSDDYSKHSNMGVVTKDNFVSLIDFNYSGNLPAEATVKIPVGADRAGQTLYYSQKVEAGYTLVQSVKVDNEGYITVKQDHCSTYVVTTTDVSKDNSADVPAGPTETPDTGDTNNVIMYVVLFVVAGTMLAVLAGSKMRKRA